jgi:MFS family permease
MESMVVEDRASGVRREAETAGRWFGQVLIVAACAAVSQGFARFTYPFVLPQMTDDVLGGSYSAAGVLGAVNLGGYLLGLLAVAWIGSRVESSRLLKAGLALTCVGLAIVGLAPNYPLLVVGMAVTGGCSAAVWIPSSGVVAARSPQRHRGVAFGVITAGIGLSIVGIGIVAIAVHRWSAPDRWREVWLIEAAVATVILVWALARLRPTPAARPSTGRARVRHLTRGFYRLTSTYFLYGASYALFTSYLIAALQDGGLTQGAAAGTYALLGLASMAGGLVLGRLSDRLSRRAVLAAGILGSGVLCLFVPLQLTGLATPVGLGYGLLMTGIGSVLVAYISDTVDMHHVPATFGVVTMSLGISQLIAPPIGGWLIDHTGGFGWTYALAAVAGVAGGIIAMTLPSARSRHR